MEAISARPKQVINVRFFSTLHILYIHIKIQSELPFLDSFYVATIFEIVTFSRLIYF